MMSVRWCCDSNCSKQNTSNTKTCVREVWSYGWSACDLQKIRLSIVEIGDDGEKKNQKRIDSESSWTGLITRDFSFSFHFFFFCCCCCCWNGGEEHWGVKREKNIPVASVLREKEKGMRQSEERRKKERKKEKTRTKMKKMVVFTKKWAEVGEEDDWPFSRISLSFSICARMMDGILWGML